MMACPSKAHRGSYTTTSNMEKFSSIYQRNLQAENEIELMNHNKCCLTVKMRSQRLENDENRTSILGEEKERFNTNMENKKIKFKRK